MNRSLIVLFLGFALLTPHLILAQDGEADDATVEVEGDGGGEESETAIASTEGTDATGQKELTLEDIQLWGSIDLDKDGKLTIGEFDRFVNSPTSRAFVNQMKSEKAVKQWADSVGIDVAKAKQAMAMGAQAQAQRNRAIAINQQRQQRAMQAQRYNQQRAIQNRQNSYFANLGRQYQRALSQRGRGRDEL